MNIHCSGIGGIGLSAYASLQHLAGHMVSGTDRSASALTAELEKQGITFSIDQSGASVPKNTDMLVYSEAIPASAPERQKATELGILQKSYPQALGELSRNYKTIAVCGTHGKSSTTSMVGRLLIQAGFDPTIVVGTKMKELDGRNWRKGESDLFVLEACEYRHSFHQYRPSIILLTNCDGDHFDFYESVDAYQEAFVTFIRSLPEDGVLITHLQDPSCNSVAERSGKNMIDADTFPLIPLQTPGLHMRQNAQLALALASVLGIEESQARTIVSGYAGSWRRLDVKGILANGVTVIDDYGHHPTEIRATISALLEQYPGRRLIVAFQPHTHDRTIKLYDDFITSFKGAHTVIVPNVYDARSEIEKATVDLPRFLADLATSSNVRTLNGETLARTEQRLRQELLQPGDVLLCLGAGDITNLASAMMK